MENQNKVPNRIDVTLTPEARTALDNLAKEDQTSAAEIVRNALRLYFVYRRVDADMDVPPAHRPRKVG